MKNAVIGFALALVVVAVGFGIYAAATRRPIVAPPPVSKTEAPATPDKKTDTPAPKTTETDTSLVRVFGTVTDSATGAAIPDADLRIRKTRGQDGAEPPAPVEAKSDKDGVFEISVARNTYDVATCQAKGYTRQRNRFTEAGRGDVRLDFQLVRGGTITGHITDMDSGAPVAGVGIEAVGAQENIMERMRSRGADPGRTTKSETDGAYILDGVPAGSYRIALDTKDAGYLYHPEDAVALELEAGKTYDNINFKLQRGAELTGRVVDSAGAAIADAHVFGLPAQIIQKTMRSIGFGLGTNMGVSDTRTDAQGQFHLIGLDYDTEFRVVAEAKGFAKAATDPLTIAHGVATPPITITLSHGSKISGVTKTPEGGIAKNEGVMLFPNSSEGWTAFMGPEGTRSGEDGAFSFDNVSAGAYTLRPEGNFRGGLMGSPSRQRDTSVHVDIDGEHDVTGIEVVVNPKNAEKASGQGTIKGKVQLPDGKPVEGARVEGRQVGNPTRSYGAKTEPDGSFELAELTGPAFDIAVTADEGIAKQAAVPVGTASLTLTLTPPASLSGQVVDRDGEPVPGCSIRLANKDEAGKVSSFVSLIQGMMGAEPGGQSTDANGFFEFTKLGPGSYVARAQSASKGTAESDPISVAAGQDVTGVQIKLSAGVTVSGVVVGAAGEFVRGATVQLAPVSSDSAANLISEFMPSGILKTAGSTTTNAEGEFTINQVAPGTYRLVASHSDYAKSVAQNFQVAPDRDITGYRITLGKGGQARGTFSINGKPQPNAMIVTLGESGLEVVQTDGQGHFEVSGLTKGPHMIAAFDPTRLASGGPGVQFSPQVVDIGDGEPTDVNLGGTGGVNVNGNLSGGNLGNLTLVALRKPDGTPLEGMDLTSITGLMEAFRSLGGQTVVGPDGAFSLENVPPGNYTLEVYSMTLDEANPDISALLNLPRSPVFKQPITVGADNQPLNVDLSATPVPSP